MVLKNLLLFAAGLIITIVVYDEFDSAVEKLDGNEQLKKENELLKSQLINFNIKG